MRNNQSPSNENRSLGAVDRLFSLAAAITGVSVRAKIMGIVVGFVLVLGISTTLEMRQMLADTLGHHLEEQAISMGSDLAARSADLILTNNTVALYELTRDIMVNNDEVRYVFVYDASGSILVHTFGNSFPPGLATINKPNPNERFHLKILETEDGLIRDVAVPIFEGKAGVARVGLSSHRLEQAIENTTRQLLTTTAFVSAGGLLAAYFLTLLLTRPVLELVRVARAVGRGDLHEKAQVWSGDEIGQLGKVFNVMIEDLAKSRNDIEDFSQQILRRNEELKRKEEILGELLKKVISAQEEERKRIARELHDETGQSLTSLMVRLKILESAKSVEELKERVSELGTLTARALEGVRDLALELRPSVLDDLGLVAALRRYTGDFARKHGIEVDYQVTGVGNLRLGPEIETAIYRIVQEALTNIAKHADATNVSVLLECRDDDLIAIIEDDGKGFDVSSVMGSKIKERKLGLFGMQERAALIGAKLTIESQEGIGTSVYVEIPSNDGACCEPGLKDNGDEENRNTLSR